MKNKRKTIIQPAVYNEAENIYEYIKSDSPQNAEKFKQELQKKIEKVEANPTAHSPENLLNNKRKLYRYTLLMKSWKLIFKVTKELLVFLGIVHIKRHPNQTQKLRTNKYKT